MSLRQCDGCDMTPTTEWTISQRLETAISTWLATADPDRHRAYRVRAWRYLREQVRGASGEPLWRLTADILYLLQKPEIRDAFFPSGYPQLAVEPATPGDHETIVQISRRHNGLEEHDALMAWLEQHPQAFFVARATDGATALKPDVAHEVAQVAHDLDRLGWAQPTEADLIAEKRAEARMKGYVGEACPECANFTLVRNGTCLKCDTCGSTTGCS